MPKMSYPRVAVVSGILVAGLCSLIWKYGPIGYLICFVLFLSAWYLLDLIEYALKHRPKRIKELTLSEVKFREESKPRPDGTISGAEAGAAPAQDQSGSHSVGDGR